MVMKAAPATAFILSEAEVLLEVLVVALDAPAHLGLVDHALERRVFAQRDSQYFIGSSSPSGHSMSSHCGSRNSLRS